MVSSGGAYVSSIPENERSRHDEDEYETYTSWERPLSDMIGQWKQEMISACGFPPWDPLEQLKQEIKSHNQDMLEKLRHPFSLDASLGAIGGPKTATDVINRMFPRQTATDSVMRAIGRVPVTRTRRKTLPATTIPLTPLSADAPEPPKKRGRGNPHDQRAIPRATFDRLMVEFMRGNPPRTIRAAFQYFAEQHAQVWVCVTRLSKYASEYHQTNWEGVCAKFAAAP